MHHLTTGSIWTGTLLCGKKAADEMSVSDAKWFFEHSNSEHDRCPRCFAHPSLWAHQLASTEL